MVNKKKMKKFENWSSSVRYVTKDDVQMAKQTNEKVLNLE